MVASRPCRFCLSLRGDSVFADFDIDDANRVFLCRISFDGYGCCDHEFKKMSLEDSQLLLEAVDRDVVDRPEVEAVLRTYFAHNSDVIWSDALADHELV